MLLLQETYNFNISSKYYGSYVKNGNASIMPLNRDFTGYTITEYPLDASQNSSRICENEVPYTSKIVIEKTIEQENKKLEIKIEIFSTPLTTREQREKKWTRCAWTSYN
uniref:Uncharacterized protein n=1 Tax=Acrobeloides nanus TaxID=290746 RepID=A0A914CDK7_9BILA